LWQKRYYRLLLFAPKDEKQPFIMKKYIGNYSLSQIKKKKKTFSIPSDFRPSTNAAHTHVLASWIFYYYIITLLLYIIIVIVITAGRLYKGGRPSGGA